MRTKYWKNQYAFYGVLTKAGFRENRPMGKARPQPDFVFVDKGAYITYELTPSRIDCFI